MWSFIESIQPKCSRFAKNCKMLDSGQAERNWIAPRESECGKRFARSRKGRKVLNLLIEVAILFFMVVIGTLGTLFLFWLACCLVQLPRIGLGWLAERLEAAFMAHR